MTGRTREAARELQRMLLRSSAADCLNVIRPDDDHAVGV